MERGSGLAPEGGGLSPFPLSPLIQPRHREKVNHKRKKAMNYHILTSEEAQYLHEYGEVLMERCGYVYHVRKEHKPRPVPGTGFYHVGNTACPWKPGESTLHGPRVNDKDNDVTIEHKGRRVVFSPEKQPSKGKNEPLLPHKTNERKIGKNWYVT